jgi:acetone carboxylase gamma subunit
MDPARRENHPEIYRQVAGNLLLHNRTWKEASEKGQASHCECGYSVAIESDDDHSVAVLSHRAERLTDVMTRLAAAAWDEGWQAQDEFEYPKMAGIFLNPYREAQWNFDPSRSMDSE